MRLGPGVLVLMAIVAQVLLAAGRPVNAKAADCQNVPITEQQTVEHIAADLKTITPDETADIRYMTLVNVVNGCATSRQMQLYRHAVIKLLNSLSRAPQPARFETIDQDGAILRVRLSALGWTTEEWRRLLYVYPYGLKSKSAHFQTIAKLTGSPLAYLRADWFTHTAARPPFYYNLLKLPRSFRGLEAGLGAVAAQPLHSYWPHRTGYTPTKVNGRIRLEPKIGYADTPPANDRGTSASAAQKTYVTVPRRQLAGTSHFRLPNGFRGYFIHHVTGPRLNASPLHPCPVCNFAGLEETAKDGGVQMTLGGLYTIRPQLHDEIRQEEDARNQAMRTAGLDPALVSQTGVEPIRALGEQFANQPLTLAGVAAELGLTSDVLERNLLKGGKEAFHTGRVLTQQSMLRGRFQARFKAIAEAATGMTVLRTEEVGRFIGLGSTLPRSRSRRRHTGGFELSMVSDKSTYKRGDVLQLSVRPQLSCNLTLISVSPDGSGVVIFPNRYSPDTYVHGGKIVAVPSRSASYTFRLNDPGEEKIISFCNADDRWSGINHKFGETAFTKIDDVAKYLDRRKDHEARQQTSWGISLPPLIASSSIRFTVE